jgi:hypothetical protein
MAADEPELRTYFTQRSMAVTMPSDSAVNESCRRLSTRTVG